MPNAALLDIMDEMADQIANALSSVTDIDIQIRGRIVGKPTPPTIDVRLGPRDEEAAAFGDIQGGELIIVRARVATADDEAQQDILIEFADDHSDLSIARAIDDDRTLNGYAMDTDLRSRTEMVQYQDGLVGIEWTFLVIPGAS